MSFLALKERRVEPEIMDEPNLDGERHVAALKGLGRVNFWTASCRNMWPHINQLMASADSKPLRILDIASGGGDIALGLWRKAKRRNLPVEVFGCDISPQAVEYAQTRADRLSIDARFFEHDVLSDPFNETYDIIVCSHFVHHLTEDQLVHFLNRIKDAATRLILIQDLTRRPGGWLFAYAGVRLITLSAVVHTDATRSVQAAFRPHEFEAIAMAAGLENCKITPHFPFRFLFSWKPS